MRTTIAIDDDLLAEAKALAARRRTTLSEVIAEGLRLSLSVSNGCDDELEPVPVYQGRGGPRPGVDLSNNAALLELDEGVATS